MSNTSNNILFSKFKSALSFRTVGLFNSSFFRKAPARGLALVALIVASALTIRLVIGAGIPPVIPPIALSSIPLYSATGGEKPVIALALSVEFPTVGSQYRDSNYSNLNEYLGYYDAESCYTYNNAPTETPGLGQTTADYKRFDRSGAATSRMCTNAFSGNFLNWSSSSAIDMLRLALSGGDRYIDTASLTILQRAVLPNGNPTCMWNSSSNFPAKQLPKDGGGNGKYWGAVPTAMTTQAAGSDIWVANTLNQIYFGTSQTGGCGNVGAYVLGGAGAAGQTGPVVNPYQSAGNAVSRFGGTLCALEGTSCTFSGVKEVLYGSNQDHWITFPASNGVQCSNNMTGSLNDPAPGFAKSCYIRAYTGAWTPTASGTLNTDGFFYSRVQVCNVTSGVLQDVRDYGLCKQYPNGNYKPAGSIQKYSDQLRLAAFGYLMDQSDGGGYSGRYGGVLRAPMKFVGAKTFSETGADNTPIGGNTNAEWSTATGVFTANPDGDVTQTRPISGVINYLNKFGRTGPTAGLYKIYDPVGEMYGEALRYLQGMQPTASAVSSITSAMYDGFPAFTTWTDPYGGARISSADYSCVRSNIVVVGDVNTWDSDRLFSRTTDVANNIQNFSAWKTVVDNFESNTSSTYVDGQGASQTTGNPNTANSASQTTVSGRQVVTGQAYWARTHDIRGSSWTAGLGPSLQRPGLRVKSYFFDVNEGGSSNTASYRQNQNQFFTASKYGGFETDASNAGGQPYNTYGNPFKRQDGTNDNNVWQNQSIPGEASTYYLQSSARGVLNAFESIFSRAVTASKSIAGAAAASPDLTPGGTSYYQAAFDTSDWSGDIIATPISLTTTGTVSSVVIGATPTWTAAARLAAMSTPATSRTIVVGRVGTTANPVASDFKWTSIDPTLQTDLQKATPQAITETTAVGQARLNYLRGDQSQEGTTYRTRTKLLGAIVNSGIAYSGAPTLNVGPSSTYLSFYSTTLSRTPAVFAGSNDGMMHAFNANTGDELFGYIPSWMGPRLSALTSKTYATNNQTYVDSSPVVGEAEVGSAGTSADWKTVLVSGAGGGGSGVFALDVTDPTAFSAAKVMWEFTRADDADLGYVVGKPQILKFRTSAPNTTATFKWFAVVASGVNNYVPDPSFSNTYSSTGNPAIFLLALDKPAGTAWTAAGSTPNYYKISLPISSTLQLTNATGVLNFSNTFGRSREVATMYMGDLHGNLWDLDFTQRGATEWTMDKLSYFKKGSSAPFTPIPLYIAKTTALGTMVQPITAAPAIAFGPYSGGVQTYYVSFITGKYLEASDKTSTATNTFYTVYDNGTTNFDSGSTSNSAIAGRARLATSSLNTTTGIITTPLFTYGRSTSDTETTTRSGFYVDFATTGERGITELKFAGSLLKFGTTIPASSGAVGSCAAAGGSGNKYTVDPTTGSGTVQSTSVGIYGGPLIFTARGGGTVTRDPATGFNTRTDITPTVDIGGGGSSANPVGPAGTTRIGRLTWRQIFNYQDLKNK